MKVMVTGSDARGHAMGYRMGLEAQEPGAERLDALYFAPGNGGTSDVGENVPLDPNDVDAAVRFGLQNKVDLTIVGPEAHIDAGLGDAFREAGLAIVCPTRKAGEIETRKDYAKGILRSLGVPTADHQAFADPDRARAYVRDNPSPKFVKVAGLAEGKGSLEALTVEDAVRIIGEVMEDGMFGEAGKTVVIEDHLGNFMQAPEASLHAAVNGRTRRLFPAAHDHKHEGEGHTGRMTGGMGVVSPLPGVTDELVEDWAQQTIDPVLDELASRGTPFEGILFAGIKLVRDSSGMFVPNVLEFNARGGSPETEVYMRRLKSNWLKLMMAIHDDTLDQADLRFGEEAAATVIMASDGYPGKYEKGLPIHGVDEANRQKGVVVFHAGTARRDGQLLTNGGRVLSVSATGKDLQQAIDRAYDATEVIDFPGKYTRPDIGRSALSGIFAA